LKNGKERKQSLNIKRGTETVAVYVADPGGIFVTLSYAEYVFASSHGRALYQGLRKQVGKSIKEENEQDRFSG